VKAHRWLGAATLAALTVLTACDGTGGQPSEGEGRLQGRLTITGSSTVAPVVGEIARRFEAGNPGVRIDVQTGGSSRGIADARRGLAHIGMVSRALGADEDDLEGRVIGWDGIAMIAHRDNPVDALTRRQVVAIFTGRVSRWDEMGGSEAPITVVNKADGRSTLELFLSHFGLRSDQVRPSVIIGDNQQGIRTVAGDPNALGYVSIGTALFEVSRGTPIRVLLLDGAAPSLAAVADGSFSLSRPLLLVTRPEPDPLARAFLDYAASPAVHDLLEAQYFVPLSF
jgi:phosphate transport system substrate-binding protein